jgi:hypothetical protein
MKNKTRSPRSATFPLTIGTSYGLIRLELEVCRNCDDHFNFRVLDTAPALSTRAAEPFLYRLMNTLEAVGSDLWLTLPPESVQQSIAAGTYTNDRVVVPVEVN